MEKMHTDNSLLNEQDMVVLYKSTPYHGFLDITFKVVADRGAGPIVDEQIVQNSCLLIMKTNRIS